MIVLANIVLAYLVRDLLSLYHHFTVYLYNSRVIKMSKYAGLLIFQSLETLRIA